MICIYMYVNKLAYNTVCPGRSDPFNMVRYYIKRVTTSWTYSNDLFREVIPQFLSMDDEKRLKRLVEDLVTSTDKETISDN